MKRSNIIRELGTHKEKLYTANEKEAIPVLFLLKYIFQHSEQKGVLKEFAVKIEKLLLFGSKEKRTQAYYHRANLELYKEIASSDLPIFQSIDPLFFDEDAIPSLIVGNKEEGKFSETQCLFEYHFSKDYDHEKEYEHIAQDRWTSFEQLKNLKDQADAWLQTSKRHIVSHSKRREAHEKLSKVEIQAFQRHVPAVVDHQLQALLEESFPSIYDSVTAVDNNSSKADNCLDVVVEIVSECSKEILIETCELIQMHLTQHHRVNVRDVLFFQTASLCEFKSTTGNMARFHLKDAIQSHKVDNIMYHHHFHHDQHFHVDEEYDNQNCENCFLEVPTDPLSIESFSIKREWSMGTPLETQILLDTFINSRSLSITKSPERYLDRKRQILYGVYDTLLNCFNQKHIGILQLANTSVLLMEYKSLKTVFAVASDMGATTSLSRAEKSIQKHIDADQLYYNTFLKKYPFYYESAAGMVQNQINIREDCHIIYMSDNFVRTSTPGNPEVGVVSGALRSIPITIQGLPMDSLITDSWHTEDCYGSEDCVCKQIIQLSKEDMEKVLMPTETEELQLQSLAKLCTWGYTDLWKELPGIFHMRITLCKNL